MPYTDQDFEATAASHTPGPWVTVEPNSADSYGDDDVWEVHDGYGRTATVYGLDPEGPANARLIAAAPDLLAACEASITYSDLAALSKAQLVERLFAINTAALAAIAKATGREP